MEPADPFRKCWGGKADIDVEVEVGVEVGVADSLPLPAGERAGERGWA
jgi:hypothetical protein